MPDRNYGIDLLRFFAAFWVVLFHLNVPYKFSDSWYKFIKIGHLGVPLFFVISGYCILITTRSSKNAFQFLIKRLFRIFPGYWISLIITSFIILIIKTDILLPHTFTEIIGTLVLTTDPISSISTINWVYWTLSFELCFYLVVFCCLLFPPKWYLNLLFLVSVLSFLVNPITSGPFSFLKHWSVFALGIGISVTFQKQVKMSYAWSFGFITINVLALTKNFLFEHVYGYYVATVLSCLLILGCSLFKIPDNFFSRLGKYSYAVYLIHVPIGYYLFGSFKTDIFHKHIYLNLAYDIFTYCIISIIAVQIYIFIEKPAIQLGKKILDRSTSIKFSDKIS